MENKEYAYTSNEKKFSEVLFDFVRNILYTICPILRFGPFPKLIDKLFASQLARSILGSYAMLLLM